MRSGPISQYRLRMLGVVCLALTILPGAGDNSARIERLGHQMMCVCGCNQILLECNHVGCTYSTTMRNELIAAVDAGSNDGGVLQTFIDKYGATVLAAPPNSGFNRILWITPFFALAIGVIGVVFVVRNWRNRPTIATMPSRMVSSGPELDHFREQARKETDL